MSDEPAWGEAPLADVVAQLLRERWDLPEDDIVKVDVEDAAGAVSFELHSDRSIFRIRVIYRSLAGEGQDPWMLLVDALDALVGQLEESGRAHRALPSGEGVVFRGARFFVEVDRTVPELERLADRLLEDD